MPPSEPPRPTVLTVLSGGGFSFETACLLRGLRGDAAVVYLVTPFGGSPGDGDLPPGPAYPVPDFATVTVRSRARSARAFLATLRASLRAIRRHRVEVVLGVGCSHLVPMMLAGRMLGRPCVFVETITRGDRLSRTGRLVLGLRLASEFYVQWPELRAAHPAARLGTIL